jgi:hypothetical protein
MARCCIEQAKKQLADREEIANDVVGKVGSLQRLLYRGEGGGWRGELASMLQPDVLLLSPEKRVRVS